MKKFKQLNRNEMKNIMGGVPPWYECAENEYYVFCDFDIPLEQGGWSHTTFTGCMESSSYAILIQGSNVRCRIAGEGGPHPI